MNWGLLEQACHRGLTSMIRRLVGKIVRAPMRACKALGRKLERRLAQRISQRYSEEITQFATLSHSIRELVVRLDKQEAFHWDHVALARRLAALEDQVIRLSDEASLDRDAGGRSMLRLASTESLATTALGQLERAG
jgi:hypothetical protein